MRTAKTDPTGRMSRLIWVFAGRTFILLVLSWGGSFAFSSLPQVCHIFPVTWTSAMVRSPASCVGMPRPDTITGAWPVRGARWVLVTVTVCYSRRQYCPVTLDLITRLEKCKIGDVKGLKMPAGIMLYCAHIYSRFKILRTLWFIQYSMSLVMRKSVMSYANNKGAGCAVWSAPLLFAVWTV